MTMSTRARAAMGVAMSSAIAVKSAMLGGRTNGVGVDERALASYKRSAELAKRNLSLSYEITQRVHYKRTRSAEKQARDMQRLSVLAAKKDDAVNRFQQMEALTLLRARTKQTSEAIDLVLEKKALEQKAESL